MRQPDPLEPIRIDHRLVTGVADASLDASREFGQATRPHLSTMDIEDGWFSRLPAAGILGAAHGDSVADALDLVESLGAGLEGDADRLYQVAFAVQAADLAAADRLGPPR